MTYALTFLRAELNRERSNIRGFYQRLNNGIVVDEITQERTAVREVKVVALKLAIEKLKKIKKVEYYFLKPERN